MKHGMTLAILTSLRRRFRYASEAELQAAIREAFDRDAIAYQPEHVLSATDRVDFFVPIGYGQGICVEVKIGGSPAALLRQLMRYAEHPTIHSLIVFTDKLRLARDLPSSLAEKPVEVVCCAEAAL